VTASPVLDCSTSDLRIVNVGAEKRTPKIAGAALFHSEDTNGLIAAAQEINQQENGNRNAEEPSEDVTDFPFLISIERAPLSNRFHENLPRLLTE
jgi:hypothetical protein